MDDYERNQEAARALWPALVFARKTTPEARWGVFVDDGKAALEVCAPGANGRAWCVLCAPPHEPFDEGAEAVIRWAADKALSMARDNG